MNVYRIVYVLNYGPGSQSSGSAWQAGNSQADATARLQTNLAVSAGVLQVQSCDMVAPAGAFFAS